MHRGLTHAARARACAQEFRDVAKHYPMIKAEEMIVDNTCMQLAGRPSQFDVMARAPPLQTRRLRAIARRALRRAGLPGLTRIASQLASRCARTRGSYCAA